MIVGVECGLAREDWLRPLRYGVGSSSFACSPLLFPPPNTLPRPSCCGQVGPYPFTQPHIHDDATLPLVILSLLDFLLLELLHSSLYLRTRRSLSASPSPQPAAPLIRLSIHTRRRPARVPLNQHIAPEAASKHSSLVSLPRADDNSKLQKRWRTTRGVGTALRYALTPNH